MLSKYWELTVGDSDFEMAKVVNEGDWLCPDDNCQNVNFARRTECNRCGTEKPMGRASGKKTATEIGKAAAEKSRGLFSADDWMCPKCGNVNWARRSTCNVCNAPKCGDDERTGLGGGYNERENVEYKEREESDGEFDEFGRRKKKFRKPDAVVSSSEEQMRSKPKVAVEEEEEDDDEDDEDADLSKYDLWGSDDDGDGKRKSDEKPEVNKNEKAQVEKDGKDRKKDRDERSSSGSSRHKRRHSSSSSSDDDRRRYRYYGWRRR